MVHPDDKGYGLELVKPVTDNKDMKDDLLLIAPQDNANFSSELEDLHLSEADWQSLSFAEEEDATHVVCGLINELSKINRIIMITHRELESMKRHKTRKARATSRHPHFPKGAANVPYLLKRKDL
ncbi:break repair meiotic recombinase recruitment factor 1-like [Leucoraja erinacea]|uniref:break repair meiotic recombinase recruitment factor 1-like n=1 Tax=Leucoraja erinaceus TaxID=7782 RepID=UPI002456BE82|nr:break repair meiotic recombinase recruitment factor 1-like [Leucoraja erinacea]